MQATTVLKSLCLVLGFVSHATAQGAVTCPTNPVEGDLCLFDKIDDHTGRLEVFHNGEWGTICTDDPHYGDLAVACRQMGLPSEGKRNCF